MDRLKSEEELAMEEKQKLEKLEVKIHAMAPNYCTCEGGSCFARLIGSGA